jgi:hypothetical protein
MQFRGNPFLVPVSRIARPNPFQLMTPAKPGLMRPNPFQPQKVKRSNPLRMPKMGSMLSIGLGSAGAVAADMACMKVSGLSPNLYPLLQGGVFLGACAFGRGQAGAAFGGAMAYALVGGILYKAMARGIVSGAVSALNT